MGVWGGMLGQRVAPAIELRTHAITPTPDLVNTRSANFCFPLADPVQGRPHHTAYHPSLVFSPSLPRKNLPPSCLHLSTLPLTTASDCLFLHGRPIPMAPTHRVPNHHLDKPTGASLVPLQPTVCESKETNCSPTTGVPHSSTR